MDSFAGIEAFAAIVERGSFTAAAAALQTAKSSISETVRALEERLGVRLLERTTRKVTPTAAGAAFYRHCRRLLEAAEAARGEAQAAQKLPAGRLRVGAPDGFAERYIVPGLPSFLAAYPAIEIELIEASGTADLLDDRLDLAIRSAERPEPKLVVRRIATQQVVIVASPGYLAAAGMPETPHDVLRHRLVGYSTLAWRATWRIGKEILAVKPQLLTQSSDSLRRAALAGLGLTALPDWLVADALVAGQLTRVLADHETPSGGIYAVYPSNRLIAPRVRLFVDHLARDLRARGLRR